MKTKMYLSSLPTENLKEFMTYAVTISDLTVKKIGNLVLTISERPDSPFNYVFHTNSSVESTEQSTLMTVDYIEKEKIDVTWVVDFHMKKWAAFLEQLGIVDKSIAKKVIAKISEISLNKSYCPDLTLELVDTADALDVLDSIASKIFYCNANELVILFRGVTQRDRSRLRFFIAKLFGTVVGLCCMFVHDQVVGLYSDGVLPQYRNAGIASEMVLRRLRIAYEQLKCEYAVAQCVEQSVGLYRRLGFRSAGNLFLHHSLAVP